MNKPTDDNMNFEIDEIQILCYSNGLFKKPFFEGKNNKKNIILNVVLLNVLRVLFFPSDCSIT